MKKPLAKELIRDAYHETKVLTDYKGYFGLWSSEGMLVRRFFPEGRKLLDLGCGAGRTSIPLAQMGFDVVGIDISSLMLEEARRQADQLSLKIDFRVMDAMSLEFDDQTFDCALYSFNGIDHIPCYDGKLEVVREIFRVLKPGSMYIFSTHRIWSPYHFRKLVAGGFRMCIGRMLGKPTLEKEWGEIYDFKAGDPVERYMSFLSCNRWKQLLKAAGFDSVCNRSRYRLEAYSTLGWLRRSLSSGNFMLYVARKPYN